VHAYHPPRRRLAEWEEERNGARGHERVDAARLEIPVGFDVAQKERLGIGVALERDVGEMSNGAVRAVTANQVAAAHVFLAAVDVPDHAGDGVVVRLK